MIANKIIKSFIIIFAILALVILFLIIFSYLSYSVNKQRDIVNQSRINQEVVDISAAKTEEFTEIELLQIVNPSKTEKELLEVKEATEELPTMTYTDDELRAEFGL